MIWAWLVHVTGSDYGLPYGRFSFYDFLSGFGANFGEVAIAVGLLRLAARQVEALAQAARHHRERMELQAAHHEDLKHHLAAQLNAHCADLKSHVTAVGSHVATASVAVPQQLLDDIAKKAARKDPGATGKGGA